MKRRQLIQMGLLATAGASAGGISIGWNNPAVAEQQFPQLNNVGNRFTFALIADPQLNRATTNRSIPKTSQEKFSQIVAEINGIRPRLPFVVINGDLVGDDDPEQVSNFLSRATQIQPLTILAHGNHDGYYPYNAFKRMQQRVNQREFVRFSFDCGRWHLLSIPCGFEYAPEYFESLMQWLDQDLSANRNRPTMAFIHYHLLPQGLTSLEGYTYEKAIRLQIINTLARYGNVKYVIHGHVHNGIQASVKTAWTYRGMNFITAPTCTASRNFGEEYFRFTSGIVQNDRSTGGGYYLLIDINNANAQIRGKLVGTSAEYNYPTQFRPYQDNEPLWFKNIFDYAPNPTLLNPSFENGLQGWMQAYRYQSDSDPGFIARTDNAPALNGGRSAYLYVREKGWAWSKDEITEVYQLVQTPYNVSPIITVNYYPSIVRLGGGYICCYAFSNRQLRFITLLDWGDGNKARSSQVSQHTYLLGTGIGGVPLSLNILGQQRQAFFWQLPAQANRWNQVQLDLGSFYDRAVGQPNAFRSLGVNQIVLAVGVYCLAEASARSATYFDALSLEHRATPSEALIVDGSAVNLGTQNIYQTAFGTNPSQQN